MRKKKNNKIKSKSLSQDLKNSQDSKFSPTKTNSPVNTPIIANNIKHKDELSPIKDVKNTIVAKASLSDSPKFYTNSYRNDSQNMIAKADEDDDDDDLACGQVPLTNNMTQKNSDVIFKETNTIESEDLKDNDNLEEQTKKVYTELQSISFTLDKQEQKNINESNQNILSVTDTNGMVTPKKEYFDWQDSSLEKILCNPTPEYSNIQKNELCSPVKSLSIQQTEDNLRKILRTPKLEKRPRPQDKTPEKLTTSQKKRKVSMSNDSDSKSDNTKPELYDTVFINEFEPMPFLHDIDALIEFEDCKLSSDVLSSMINDNVAQGGVKDGGNLIQEQPKDPLAIDMQMTPMKKDVPRKVKSYPQPIQPINKTKLEKSMKQSRSVVSNQSTFDSTIAENIKEEFDAIKEKEEFSLSVINWLMDLEIKLIHTVPPQHKIEHRAGTHVPTPEENEKIQQLGPLRKGKFSPAEDDIIKQNWKMFCKLHEWNVNYVEPFKQMRHNGKYYINRLTERQKFVQFLANGLPWRSLYSVYTRFKTLYDNHKTQIKYTPEEDTKILAYMQNISPNMHHKPRYTELAKVLGRSPHSVCTRHKLLEKRQEMVQRKEVIDIKVIWTLPLIEKFVKKLLEVTFSKDIQDLKGAIIPKAVWLKMESIFRIGAKKLKSFWLHQLHMQLFSPYPIYLNDIRILLIEYMYGKGINHIREIKWPNVAKYFDGMTSVFLCHAFFHLLRDCGIDLYKENLYDVVEYLYHYKIPEIQEEHVDKFLPRLKYKNNTLRHIDKVVDAIHT